MRSAVTYLEIGEADQGRRLDNVLATALKPLPKSRIYRLVRKGEVRVNGGRSQPDYRLQLGDRVRIPPVQQELTVNATPGVRLQKTLERAVIYEDNDFLVVNKPAGVAVHGGSGLSFGVIEALRASRPELRELELAHRLDRDTSGCLLVAKRRAVLRALHAMLREREMDKVYIALLCGKWTLGKKRIEAALQTDHRRSGERHVRVHTQGQASTSLFKPQRFFGQEATLVEVEIGTGRTHQIRVHAAHAGHPVAGDEKYGSAECNAKLENYGLKRMFLHAHSLSFVRPGSAEVFSVSAPLDDELRQVLEQLERAYPKSR